MSSDPYRDRFRSQAQVRIPDTGLGSRLLAQVRIPDTFLREMDALRISPEHTIPAAALSWTATTSGGPGGQHANRAATRVELRCDVRRSRLPRDVVTRMRRQAPRFFGDDGELLIVSERTRSQRRNLDDARERLRDLVRRCWRAPARRRPTRPSRGARERRLDAKKQHGEKKRWRSWRPDRG